MKKTTFVTTLEGLWGREHYAEHITVGSKYWGFFVEGTSIYKYTHKHWNILTISYIRSGVVFFTVDDTGKEFHFEIGSFLSMKLEVYILDPLKDLPWFVEHYSDRIEFFRFDDAHTKVINFDNSKTVKKELIKSNVIYIE